MSLGVLHHTNLSEVCLPQNHTSDIPVVETYEFSHGENMISSTNIRDPFADITTYMPLLTEEGNS